MRVVYVSTLARGGPVSHLLDLAPRVAALGVDVRVACADGGVAGAFRARGVDAVPLSSPVRSKWDVRGASALWPLLADADVVHTHDRRAGLFARVLGRARGAAVVHTYHGLPEEIAVELGRDDGYRDPSVSALRRAWLRGGYLRIEGALAMLGVVVVPSAAMAAYLAAAGVPRARLRVIASGIDVVRAEPGGRHDPPVVATMANLERWKGVDVLLDACALVARERRLRVDVYGDGDERGALEAQAARLGVDVTFLGHVVGARDRLVVDADVVVVPSRAENLPVAALEAMAAALPVVATRVGGVPELVDDGVTGFVVPPDDAPAMAAAIGKVLADDDLRVAMGRSGAARVASRFSADGTARALVDLYEQRCASSR
jgi:glycosyltransferase involved in cell wall biosynthesis